MIRVAFLIDFSAEVWTGGINYFVNLIDAIYALDDRKIEPVVFVNSSFDAGALGRHPGLKIVRTGLLDQSGTKRFLRSVSSGILGRELLLGKVLSKERVSLISHSGLRTGAGIPSLGWIPDFQHVYLPEFFSPGEIKARESYFKSICADCEGVIVSSLSAQKDLSRFAPGCAAKSRVLQFVAGVPDRDRLPERKDLERRYGFKGPYIYLPNQFWAHKNHGVVLESLKILKDSGKNVKVIATGNTRDYRQPGHLKTLTGYMEANGLAKDFIILGLVPRMDVFGLMRHSIAALNPSLFEGWSTTIEEAKSMGKRTVLSDIPVHREQDPPEGVFFDPKDPEALAGRMWDAWSSARDGKGDDELMRRAAAALPGRRKAFAKRYEEIVSDFVKENRCL